MHTGGVHWVCIAGCAFLGARFEGTDGGFLPPFLREAGPSPPARKRKREEKITRLPTESRRADSTSCLKAALQKTVIKDSRTQSRFHRMSSSVFVGKIASGMEIELKKTNTERSSSQ